MNYKLRTKAFTLVELLVAISILVIVLSTTSIIFKVCIESQRKAGALTEVMRNLRGITDQLDRDFKGLQKDGWLVIRPGLLPNGRADRIYYFASGDYQSWFDTTVKSNIARVYFGVDGISLDGVPVGKRNLARDVLLLTPGTTPVGPPPLSADRWDYFGISYSACRADLVGNLENPDIYVLGNPIPIDVAVSPPLNVQSLICQNVGAVKIEWSDGTIGAVTAGVLDWWGLDYPNGDTRIELPIGYYLAVWFPQNAGVVDWPKAIKFTFTLYDSKGILDGGRTFTHIVYLE